MAQSVQSLRPEKSMKGSIRPSSANPGSRASTRIGEQTMDSRHWTKDDYKYVALHDKGHQPAFIFREVYKEGLDYPVGKGTTHDNKAEEIASNTYHHAWSKSVSRRLRPASAKPPTK